MAPSAATQRGVLEDRIAADIRRLRGRAGHTLEQLSKCLDHERNWLSAIERRQDGARITLADFLLLMSRLREIEPDHPAVALYDHYTA